MGTLYIDKKDMELRLDGEAIAFYVKGIREGLAPIVPLKRVIICGKALIDTRVLHRLANRNISVIFLSGRQMKFAGSVHGKNHNNGILRIHQYRKSHTPFARRWANRLIRKKISIQMDFLKDIVGKNSRVRYELLKGIKILEDVIKRIDDMDMDKIETLRGFEGGAASAYFSSYTALFPPSLCFKKRTRRPPTDPVNSLLSLNYTLIHWEAVREIELAGLDPTIGFYHAFEYGRESLACDLIEPVRPVVDRWVFNLFRERSFTDRDFTTDKGNSGCYLKKGRRRHFYHLYEEWVGEIRGLIKNEARELIDTIMGE